MSDFQLDDRAVVVTGESSGIGAECARLFAGAGARVIVGYSNGEERARSLASALPGHGDLALNVALEGEHEILAKQLSGVVVQQVHLLMNLAGQSWARPSTSWVNSMEELEALNFFTSHIAAAVRQWQVIAGEVDVLVDTPTVGLPHVQSGRLRVLGVTSANP